MRARVEFDADAVAAAMPASVQSLLTARVDRLAPQDRALLQAAAVIGRRFDPQLLAVVADDAGDIEARLAAMQALDLVYPEGKSGDYVVQACAGARRALSEPAHGTARRAASEDRRGDRAPRRQPPGGGGRDACPSLRPDGSCGQSLHLSRHGGAKSLGVYSLDEADNYFAAAIALLDKNPDCATDAAGRRRCSPITRSVRICRCD